MRWQTTAALAVILLALGAFYYIYEIRLGPEREKAEGAQGPGCSPRRRAMSPRSRWSGAAETLKFQRARERAGGCWPQSPPGPIAAAVDELVTSVAHRQGRSRGYSRQPRLPHRVRSGLTAADVTVTLKDGKQTGHSSSGARIPPGSGCTGERPGSPQCSPYRIAYCATPPDRWPNTATRPCWRSTGAV